LLPVFLILFLQQAPVEKAGYQVHAGACGYHGCSWSHPL